MHFDVVLNFLATPKNGCVVHALILARVEEICDDENYFCTHGMLLLQQDVFCEATEEML